MKSSAAGWTMAGQAADRAENRQTCVDVLCAYLRMPYAPDPGDLLPHIPTIWTHPPRAYNQSLLVDERTDSRAARFRDDMLPGDLPASQTTGARQGNLLLIPLRSRPTWTDRT